MTVQNKKIVAIIFMLIFAILVSIVLIERNESDQMAIMYGETFCLSGCKNKCFYRIPNKVLRVYGYNEMGDMINYKEGRDYIIDYNRGTIARTISSLIPDYKDHKIIYQNNGKFIFSAEPRNPELNILFQVKVDYSYKINSKDKEEIVNSSTYLSNGLRDKIIGKKEIKIVVAGDSIAVGAQTTSQYFFNDRIKDTFSGYLKETLESYYKCTVDMNVFSEGGSDRNFLLDNINTIIDQNPDVVIVEFGMNDHAVKNSLDSERVESFYCDMKKAVKSLLENDIDVIVVGFFKQNPNWEKENPAATNEYNEILKKVANECNVYFADVGILFDKVGDIKDLYEDVTADYMHHPTDWGHKLYLSALLPAFNVDGKMNPQYLKNYILVN